MKHITYLILLVAFTTYAPAQWPGFVDPGYGGTTQHSEWDVFATDTNATPDLVGNTGLISETSGNGFRTSTFNIYSFSGNMSFELAADSINDLGQVSVQIVTWGQADPYVGDTTLTITDANGNDVQSLNATTDEIFLDAIIDHPTYGPTLYIGRQFTWDLSNYPVTSYYINFDLLVHTSLALARLDTTTEVIETPAEIIPVTITIEFIGNDLCLIIPTNIGNYYQVKWTNDLSNSDVSTWNNLGTKITGDGSIIEVEDQDSSNSNTRFYSVVITNE